MGNDYHPYKCSLTSTNRVEQGVTQYLVQVIKEKYPGAVSSQPVKAAVKKDSKKGKGKGESTIQLCRNATFPNVSKVFTKRVHTLDTSSIVVCVCYTCVFYYTQRVQCWVTSSPRPGGRWATTSTSSSSSRCRRRPSWSVACRPSWSVKSSCPPTLLVSQGRGETAEGYILFGKKILFPWDAVT